VNIYLLRHGIAAPPSADNDYRDEDRALTPEGEVKMRQAAEGLKRLGVSFTRIASSPLLRAQQTAEIVAEVLRFGEPLEVWRELEPEATVDGVMNKLRKLPEDSAILLAGHQPSIGCLASYLVAGNRKASLPFKKGAVFAVRVSQPPSSQPGELQWMLTSKMLRQIAEL
jgi:phosphohistidine phosphatase